MNSEYQKPQLSTRTIKSILIYLKKIFNQSELNEFVESAGLPLDYLEDENNWISVSFKQRFLNELIRATGNPKAPFTSGTYAISKEAYGMLYYLFNIFGSPKLTYKKIVEYTPRYDKVGSFRLVNERDNEVTLEYCIDDKNLYDLNSCEHIRGQLASVPAVWNMPLAVIEHSECIATGANSCVYKIKWQEFSHHLYKLIGLLCGIIFSAIFISFFPDSSILFYPFLFCILVSMSLIGQYCDYRAILRLANEFNEGQKKILVDSFNVIETKYEELRKTNEELNRYKNHLEELVSERTSKLEETLKKLKELDILKTNFIANISHELRTPLTAIINPIESILNDEYQECDNEIRGLLSIVANNACRLHKVINNLLDISKLEAKKMKLFYQKVPVIQYIDYLISAILPIAEKKGITINRKYPDRNIYEFFDPDKMEKVVLNILSNALKFTDSFGTINIEITSNDKTFCLIVQDSGIGMAEEHFNIIFDRFTQIDSSLSKKHEGTGIGLALSKELVDLHNGKISVKSKLQEGSTFTVILPRLNLENVPEYDLEQYEDTDRRKDERRRVYDRRTNDRRCNEDRRTNRSRENLIKSLVREKSFDNNLKEKELASFANGLQELPGRPYVTLIDDNPDIIKLLIMALKNKYNLSYAFDGESGLRHIKKNCTDIVISDVMMPRLSGYELCNIIKKDEQLKTIPVILLTSKTDIDSKITGYQIGADDYITKPFNSRELNAKIEALLKLKRVFDEYNQSERMISIGRLSAGIAHEINNPVNFIVNNIESLKRALLDLVSIYEVNSNGSCNPELKKIIDEIFEMIDLMQEGGSRTLHVVRNLKTFSRVDEAKLKDANVNECIELTISLLNYLIKDKIKIHRAYNFLQDILCYPGLLNQVFMNVLNNAVQAILEKKNEGNIWIKTEEENSNLLIRIENDGPSMDDKVISRIFEPFFTTKEVGIGTGLGLSISYGIVEKHNGKIHAQNTERGVEFVVSIPLTLSGDRNA